MRRVRKTALVIGPIMVVVLVADGVGRGHRAQVVPDHRGHDQRGGARCPGRGAEKRARHPDHHRRLDRRPVLRAGIRSRTGSVLGDGLPAPRHGRPPVGAVRRTPWSCATPRSASRASDRSSGSSIAVRSSSAAARTASTPSDGRQPVAMRSTGCRRCAWWSTFRTSTRRAGSISPAPRGTRFPRTLRRPGAAVGARRDGCMAVQLRGGGRRDRGPADAAARHRVGSEDLERGTYGTSPTP